MSYVFLEEWLPEQWPEVDFSGVTPEMWTEVNEQIDNDVRCSLDMESGRY